MIPEKSPPPQPGGWRHDLAEAANDPALLLDQVPGAAHSEVGEAEARDLMRQLTATLPGYLVPKLVRKVAGAESKVGVI